MAPSGLRVSGAETFHWVPRACNRNESTASIVFRTVAPTHFASKGDRYFLVLVARVGKQRGHNIS